MKDQNHYWNEFHQAGRIDSFAGKPTEFALEVMKMLPKSMKILELGCGLGNDSIAFANSGHIVTAIDFSEVVIVKNSERFKKIQNLNFIVADMSTALSFDTRQFDVVYARLALHYFTDEVTRRIIYDIQNLLTDTGYFCFMCKSIDDPLYDQGVEIEKDMFENRGHVRHFFSEDYVKSLLGNNFKIIIMESRKEMIYGSKSAYVKVISKAIQ